MFVPNHAASSYLNEYYVRQHDGFFLIYSVAYRPSFERIEVFHSTIMRIKKYDSTSFAVVLIGNQSDREGDRRVGKNGMFPCRLWTEVANVFQR